MSSGNWKMFNLDANARKEERRQKRIAEGLCVDCPNPRGTIEQGATHTRCKECSDFRTRKARARRGLDVDAPVVRLKPRTGNGPAKELRVAMDEPDIELIIKHALRKGISRNELCRRGIKKFLIELQAEVEINEQESPIRESGQGIERAS